MGISNTFAFMLNALYRKIFLGITSMSEVIDNMYLCKKKGMHSVQLFVGKQMKLLRT